MLIILDTGPLGMITNPRASAQNEECAQWLAQMIVRGHAVAVPEIADYELRRELIRANKVEGLERLDALNDALIYLPVTTVIMRKAAQLWAEARNQGKPTAPMEALDADVILAAQTISLSAAEKEVVVATTNVGHLSLFVDAKNWREIS
jgi:predicted nucleic acid-binding protein